MKSLSISLIALALIPTAAATEVDVNFSETFAEKLVDNYGVREGDRLTKKVKADLERAFAKEGVEPARVEVTILDAKPNRPTHTQVGRQPGLDMFRSISLGGMELTGIAYDVNGDILASQDYEWFESDLRRVIGNGTWTDANRASRRFATRLADQLGDS